MQRVEKYEVREELGHGGMATVFRARDTHLERDVALKILHPHLRTSSEARQRFAREAKSVAKLKHPHILEVYDFSGADSEHSYIATELLTGPTLKDFGAKHPELPAEVAVAMTLQISRALEAAHGHGIIHRDVKPENVMIHEGRTLKLTDFGIAQILDTQSFTATGQILGSPGHMAPEQVETGEVDERSDLFALGTVLYFLACGRLPFTGRNPHQILRRVMDTEYQDPLRVCPSIGATLARIISRCLARNPADRYANAAELSAALTAWCASVGLHDPDAAVAAYLEAPAATAEALTKASVAQLVRTGAESIRARDIPAAMDAFNRVLALDEGNVEALRQIETLSATKRSPLPLVFAAAGALLIALAVGFAALDGERAEADPTQDPQTGQPLVSDEGDTRGLPSRHVQDAGALAERPTGDASATSPVVAVVDRGPSSGSREERPPARVVPRGPRRVIFQPSPANVEIAVDGGPLRAFGPSFREATLTPGQHSFRVVGGAECCVERTFVSDIPAGEEPFELSLRLALRPASVYVVANIPADVVVAGGAGAQAQGRTREILAVPMSRAEDTRRLTVTAEGHRVYTGVVRLRAGQLTEHQVSLEASPVVQESPPPPEPN